MGVYKCNAAVRPITLLSVQSVEMFCHGSLRMKFCVWLTAPPGRDRIRLHEVSLDGVWTIILNYLKIVSAKIYLIIIFITLSLC